MGKGLAKIVIVFAAVILAVAAAFTAMIYFAFFRATFVRREYVQSEKEDLRYYATEANVAAHYADEAWFESMNPQLVKADSFDGLKLSALKLDREDDKGTIIMMHGFHSEPLREFATIARFYYGEGYSLLLPYHRSHGKSEGKYLTFGIKERYDCKTWIDFVNGERGIENDVYLHGISMGCATVLMASSLDLPFNVRGIIADCGFTSPYEITYWTTKKRGVKRPELAMKLCGLMTRLFAGFELDEYSTLRAMNVNLIPVLFITGTADERVPMEMTIQNFNACRAPKELLLIEDSPHAINYFTDPEKYESHSAAFIKKYALFANEAN